LSQQSTLEVQFESGAVQSFVSGIRKMIKTKTGKANLAGISPYTQNIV